MTNGRGKARLATQWQVGAVPLAAAVLLAACGQGAPGTQTAQSAASFDAIGPDETVRLTGNEPFWDARIADGELSYTSLERPDARVAQVERFAGLGGLGWSGTLDGEAVDIALTQEPCSDSMSDRIYPFSITLIVGGETRRGCAWTDARPFEGPQNP